MDSVKTYVYQLTDHLCNVRAVFMKEDNEASLEGYTDYYPDGMTMFSLSLVNTDGYNYTVKDYEKALVTVKK